jgi:hypothetical protein
MLGSTSVSFQIRTMITIVILFVTLALMVPLVAAQQEASVSDATDACLICHTSVTPGIVADWQRSRHSSVTPQQAIQREQLYRRVSATEIPDSLATVVVGCAECHMMNADTHEDTFDHSDYPVHTVVTPADCNTCHPDERAQYSMNLMSHAHVNLVENPTYEMLIKSINGVMSWTGDSLVQHGADSLSDDQSCLFCHGTNVTVAGLVERETAFGTMTFPDLTGWPNRGVGRLNPDGSMGACTPCHPRHEFAIEVARQPYTCSECHKGPDVPAYKIYSVSKHGNIFSSQKSTYTMDTIPWTIGKDFNAPTCAVCHISLVEDTEGEIVARRTHQMNDRLYTRLFGLPYAHPHPRSPNTTSITNAEGLHLPTNLDGTPVSDALIDEETQAERKATMQQVCKTCHSDQWVTKHFEVLDAVVSATNKRTLSATQILQTAWSEGIVDGPGAGDSPFNDGLEKLWVEQWLFYANSVRLSAAMAGADYGVFENGRWHLAHNLQDMYDRLRLLKSMNR